MDKFLYALPSKGCWFSKGKKRHNDKFSNIEESNRVKSKLKQM